MNNPVTFTLRGAFIALTALCAISVSQAEDIKAPKVEKTPEMPAKYDTNNNHKIDPNELAAWKADQAKVEKTPDIPTSYDTNKNGKLDANEKAAWQADQAKAKTHEKKKGDPE